jgi:hypothetical protein
MKPIVMKSQKDPIPRSSKEEPAPGSLPYDYGDEEEYLLRKAIEKMKGLPDASPPAENPAP